MYASSCSRLSHGEHVWLAAEDTPESLGGAIVRVLKDETLYIQAGGGVVFDSDPEAEYQETVNKSNALRRAAEDAGRFAGRGTG